MRAIVLLALLAYNPERFETSRNPRPACSGFLLTCFVPFGLQRSNVLPGFQIYNRARLEAAEAARKAAEKKAANAAHVEDVTKEHQKATKVGVEAAERMERTSKVVENDLKREAESKQRKLSLIGRHGKN